MVECVECVPLGYEDLLGQLALRQLEVFDVLQRILGVDHPIVGERRLGAIVEPLEELVARLGVAEEVVGLLQECASGVTLVVDNLEEHVW